MRARFAPNAKESNARYTPSSPPEKSNIAKKHNLGAGRRMKQRYLIFALFLIAEFYTTQLADLQLSGFSIPSAGYLL